MKFLLTLMLSVLCVFGPEAHAGAAKTTYPVVFAHGVGGFDDILGYNYWGDDYGMFVGTNCQSAWICNGDLAEDQQMFIGQVQPMQSSEVRGLDLANEIEGYMASVGASRVNIIGHSLGGIDARKAAKVLRERKGYTVVAVLVSVSSPHRGSPVAKYILDLKPGVTDVLKALATYYGDIVYGSGNDAFAAAKQLIYNDYTPSDGITTGTRAFNVNNPINARYASRYASLITAQKGITLNPALYLVRNLFYDIDGNGFCAEDCDNDGAAGQGNANPGDDDDDGLVGINSQQMGYRLRFSDTPFFFDSITTDNQVPYLSDLNAPSSLQMTSSSSVISQDHMDVVGVGPDTFDEPEFYAALVDYIAAYD
jgi:triacylglycerol lipase